MFGGFTIIGISGLPIRDSMKQMQKPIDHPKFRKDFFL